LNTTSSLDALVNNAAVALPSGSLGEQMAISFQTNATGPLLVGEAFAPLLRQSQTTPRIVNVSSGAGSITKRLDSTSKMYKMKTPQYNCSKAALNMVTAW
jgi:NAD(P)-dependent dehydrogenase (short-subunit alcohol dehydrogenase family)